MKTFEKLSRMIYKDIDHPAIQSFVISLNDTSSRTSIIYPSLVMQPDVLIEPVQFDFSDHTKNEEAVKQFLLALYYEAIREQKTEADLRENAVNILGFFLEHHDLQSSEDRKEILEGFLGITSFCSPLTDNNPKLTQTIVDVIKSDPNLQAMIAEDLNLSQTPFDGVEDNPYLSKSRSKISIFQEWFDTNGLKKSDNYSETQAKVFYIINDSELGLGVREFCIDNGIAEDINKPFSVNTIQWLFREIIAKHIKHTDKDIREKATEILRIFLDHKDLQSSKDKLWIIDKSLPMNEYEKFCKNNHKLAEEYYNILKNNEVSGMGVESFFKSYNEFEDKRSKENKWVERLGLATKGQKPSGFTNTIP